VIQPYLQESKRTKNSVWYCSSSCWMQQFTIHLSCTAQNQRLSALHVDWIWWKLSFWGHQSQVLLGLVGCPSTPDQEGIQGKHFIEKVFLTGEEANPLPKMWSWRYSEKERICRSSDLSSRALFWILFQGIVYKSELVGSVH
jgi:hypothetical protein